MLFRVSGRVQGVGFRVWTLRRALARGLAGWVRNEPDGSVTVLAAGPDEQLSALRAELECGPPAARVEAVTVAPAATPAVPGFRVD